MRADLNTSGALAVIFDLVREINAAIDDSTLGGGDAAAVLDTFGYFRGIQAGDYGFATAVGMVKSIVGLVLIVGANWFAKRIGEEGIV